VNDDAPTVGVLVASPAELALMQQATAILEKLGVRHEIRVMSAHRNPDLVDEYARTAFERGIKALICSTGISGHLAAAVASRTVIPVVGVPIASDQMPGDQALVVTAQMPSGVPVATVGVDAPVNAAVLAAQIVGVADPDVQKRLWRFKDDLGEGLRL
jgi:5-(carboxyamino)imidazole ribonucleotide mutase